MSVRNGFMIEIYGLMHCLRTYLLAHAAQDAIASIWKIEDDARMSPDVWKTVNCSTKDERQDNSDKKRLARHNPSDLLRLLTHERIGGGQHGVVSPAL